MKYTQSRLERYLRAAGPIAAIAIASLALYLVVLERQESNRVNPGSAPMGASEAQFILTRAEDAVDAASLVLTFLEGASVLAGIILVGAGIFGITSIQDLRHDTEAIKQEVLTQLAQAQHDLNERVDVAQRELFQKAEQLASLEAELENSIEKNSQRIDEQINLANKQARLSFEALSYHVMAQRLAREDNIDAAISACREAHELDPDNMSNNYLLGTLLLKKNLLEEAVLHLTEAYDAALQDSETVSTPSQAALGLALRKQGDLESVDVFERNRLYNQAENYLLEVVQHDPHLLTEDGESYFGVLGSLYRRQGRTQDAIEAYERAAAVTPRRSYPFINLAMLCLAAGEEARANHYRQAAEQKAARMLDDRPDHYWARHDMALAQYLKQDIDRALQSFEEAIELSPSVSVLDSVLSRLLYLQRISSASPRIEEALAQFQNAKQKHLATGGS